MSIAQLSRANPGDILLFSQPHGGLGAVISLVTRSPYYHVAIFERDTFSIEARQRGVVRRDLRTKEGGHTWTVVPAPQGSGAAALAWAVSRIGDRFDRLDFLVILLDRIVGRLRIHYEPLGKYSCSEFVARAFREAGVVLFPELQDADVEPADFARLLPNGVR
ncbi:MAG TPA: hypothetical protein VGT60_03765 [Candidatus Limnocylindria bacterium]|nr:hypothetical protein [Candidatus Limnocylindria bacterium]